MANKSDRGQAERHCSGDRDRNGKQCDAVTDIVRVDVTRRWSDLGERKDISVIDCHVPGEQTLLRASKVRSKGVNETRVLARVYVD